MKLSEALPNAVFPAALGEFVIKWDDDQSCDSVVGLMRLLLNEAQFRHDDVEGIASRMVQDLIALKATLPQHTDVFDVLQFDVALTIMGIGAGSKRIPMLWTWTIRSLQDGPVEHQVEFEAAARLHSLNDSQRGFVRRTFLEVFLSWASFFYYAATRTGQFSDLADALFILTAKSALRSLPNEEAVDALRFALDWDAINPPLRGGAVARKLYEIVSDQGLPELMRARIKILFAGRVGEKHGFNTVEEAKTVLENYSKPLQAHERLQMLAAVVGSSLEQLTAKKEEILSAIDEYNKFARAVAPDDLKHLYDKGPIFDVLIRLLVTVLEAGQIEVAIELIAAWNEIPRGAPLIDSVLFVLPTRPGGIGISSAVGFKESVDSDHESKFRTLIEATNRALDTAINVPHDPQFTLVTPARDGQPNYEHGSEFEKALENFYAPEAILDSLKKAVVRSSSTALIPYINHPLQGLLLKLCDVTLPYCYSWRRAETDREIRRALIFADQVMTSEIELAEILRIFGRASIDCTVLRGESATKQKFLEGYESDAFDLIWVISHGEYKQYDPHSSFIAARGVTGLTMEELGFANLPSRDRRLLVLNVCSGGSAAVLGGLPDIGLSSALVTPYQAVIAHLWPVPLWAPVAFAVLLAGALITRDGFLNAFDTAMRSFIAGKDTIFEKLGEAETSAECMTRLERSDEDWNNILVWGSPVFFQ